MLRSRRRRRHEAYTVSGEALLSNPEMTVLWKPSLLMEGKAIPRLWKGLEWRFRRGLRTGQSRKGFNGNTGDPMPGRRTRTGRKNRSNNIQAQLSDDGSGERKDRLRREAPVETNETGVARNGKS